MKKETIKALAEKLNPTSREELHQVAQAMSKVDLFPEIEPMELARLVEMRMRKKGASSATDMVNEIESTIDMVQACEFMLAVRRLRWRADERQIKETIYGTPEPTEKEKAIYAAEYPMEFKAGLIKMGVPERDREGWYEKFYRDRYAYWRYAESPSSWPSFAAFIESHTFTDTEIKAAFERVKAEGWTKADYLQNITSQWEAWWSVHKHDGRRKGGKESGNARAAKKATTKKPKGKPRSSR